jgi:hypothetical protein
MFAAMHALSQEQIMDAELTKKSRYNMTPSWLNRPVTVEEKEILG